MVKSLKCDIHEYNNSAINFLLNSLAKDISFTKSKCPNTGIYWALIYIYVYLPQLYMISQDCTTVSERQNFFCFKSLMK